MHALYDTQRGSFMSYSDCAGSNGSHDKFLYGLQGVKVTIKIALSTISFLIVTRAELCGFVALKKRLLICMRRDVLLDVYCCLLLILILITDNNLYSIFTTERTSTGIAVVRA